MQLQREMIPGKPTEGMDDDNIEGCAASRCHIEQALRFRAAVVGAARTGFDEFNNGVPAARGAEGECLPPLWGHAGGGEIPADSSR